MDWKVGFKLTHPFNADWGVGEVQSVGTLGRQITVRFPATGEQVTLSTHDAAFQRWCFPLGSRARVTRGPLAESEVVLVERRRDEENYDRYRTADGQEVREQDLFPLDRLEGPLERLRRLDVDPLDHYECRVAGASLDLERQAQGLAGMLGARVTLFPHQLHVAWRGARKYPVRALLADEVGLGKTIEAGMIYSALRHAGRAERVLVLAPDAITVQWLGELYRKFHDVFVLIDDERLADAEQDHPNLSPWQVYPRAVCSLQFLMQNQMLAVDAAEVEPGWDLLIVDEAHHLRYEEDGGNDAYLVVEAIAGNARNILFLTATPMELDRREYFGLLRLLRPSLFHDYELFEIQLEEIAQASEIAATLEEALGEHPDDDQGESSRPATAHAPRTIPPNLPDLVADTFTEAPHLEELAIQAVTGERQAILRLLEALTQMHPLGDTVFSNTRARVGGFPPRQGELRRIPLSPSRRAIYDDLHRWAMEVGSRLDAKSIEAQIIFDLLCLAAGPLAGLKTELARRRKNLKTKTTVALFDDLMARCDKVLLEDSARLDALLEEVRQAVAARQKLLVFVHHVADLEHLRDRIEARVGVRVATFHERLPAADRDIQVAMFRSPDGYPVLLSSEAGGEGRNFQFCHRLIHFDLPASPNRVEQRIGRLDRIGQNHEVQSVVLAAEDTVEAEMASIFFDRIGVFHRTIGGLDPVMEQIASRVVSLSLSKQSRDPDAWRKLGEESDELLNGARDAITRGLDHLLHRGGYDPIAAQELMKCVPKDLGERLEEFVLDFCEQTGISIQDNHVQGTYYLALDRYCTLDGLPGVPLGSAFVGTFQREKALEREDFEYFATGQPLIEGIFHYLKDTPFGTATLRRYRKTGQKHVVGIQFNYRLSLDSREDIDIQSFFAPRVLTLAVDLQGQNRPELVPLLTARHSKAWPIEPEDFEEVSAQPGWMDRAAETAERLAGECWDQAAQEAETRFADFARDARQRLEAFFEHRLDSAEARLAFAKQPAELKAAREEVKSLRKEWKERLEQLEHRHQAFRKGRPTLDSVAVFVMD